MKVAVIGAGDWGVNIIRNLHSMGSLGGVAEVNQELQKDLVEQYPEVSLHSDYHTFFKSDVPAVAISTPAQTHYAIAKEALSAGKDVFVEKPLALSTVEAEELVALARDRGRILMVGHLLLYQPAVQWIKQYLDEGALGKVSSLHQERLNLGRIRTVENTLWSLGVHDVAVLFYLIGNQVESVNVSGQCVLNHAIEDDIYLHMTFSNGTVAHLHTSWLWPERCRKLVVIGSKAMMTYDEIEQTVTLHKKSITPDLENHDEGEELVFQGHGQPLKLELAHFLACMKDRTSPISDGESAVNVVRVLETATHILEKK